MSSRFSLSPLFIGVVLLAAVVVYLNLPSENEQRGPGNRQTPVKTSIVSMQSFPVTIEALGTAVANESVTITAQVTDTVQAVNFEDGDKVVAGQVLVELNNREELARIAELEANIKEAKRQYSRVVDLRQSSAASEQLLDEQQARVKALEAQLDVAKAQLDDLNVKAPFAGYLGVRQISKGALVRPADAITTLDDISVVKVDFSVSENQLASLSNGQHVSASSVAYPGVVFEGTISNIDTRLDPVSRSISVRAIIDNSEAKLRPGMLMTIVVEKRVLNTLIVPERALVPVQDKQYVYVVENDTVSQREVLLGERRPGFVQVVSGLTEGEEVVVDGTLRVQDQSKVRVLSRVQDDAQALGGE